MSVIQDEELVGVATLTDLLRFNSELIRSYTVLMRAQTEPNVLKTLKLRGPR